MAGEQDGLDLTMPAPSPSGDAPTDLASGGAGGRGDEPDSLLGNVLAGRYRIDRRLGSGGMGAVFAGTHLLLDRPVAIKVMKPRIGDDPDLALRFVQEAKAASGIAHAHVVQITDFGQTETGGAYIVMEHLDGEDLAQTLQREGPMPWQRVVHIAEQIARALAAAHKQGIVHRDIKPANCFRVTRDDDPDYIKVLDFGLAKVIGEHSRTDRSLTATGALLGTPGYIAPELYRGLPADHRVDLYALGAVMYKLLTGELPPMSFTAAREVSGVSQLQAPPHLQAIVRRALAEDPAARYPTAQALAADLRAMAGGAGVRLDPISDPASSFGGSKLLAVNRRGRRFSLTIGAPLLALLLAGGGVLIWFAVTRERDDRPERDRTEDRALPAVAAPPPIEPPLVAPPPPPEPVPEDSEPAHPAKRPHGKRPHADDPTTGPPVDLPSVTDDPAAPKDPAPPADTSPAPSDTKPPDPAPADTKAADPPPVPADTPPDATDPAPAGKQGSPAALQKKIARACGSKLLSYTLKVQWTARPDGALDVASVKPLEPATDLNADHACALKQIKRSTYAWNPGKTYTHTFDIGG